jgi:hypothetical protein
MRTIHAACSSLFVLSLVAGCSGGGLPGENAGIDGTTEEASEALANGAPAHQMPGHADVVVGGSCAAGSTLTNPNNKPVMHGTVNVYFIWYGGNVSQNVIGALKNYVPALSESSFLASNSIYNDANGPTTSTLAFGGATTDAIIANANGLTGAPYSQGKTLSDANIKTEVDRAIAGGIFPKDTNGIYFVVTDNLVSESNSGGKFCGTAKGDFCAWHTHGTTSKSNIKYAFIGDPNVCTGCQWLHLQSEDYLVQMIWVNPDASGSIKYGLPFWGQNFGYNGSVIGDWAYGSYKAQCSSGQPVTGISEDVSETHVNSVLCSSSASWQGYMQSSSCYGLSFNPGNNMISNPEGDWDRGYYKAECNTNEFVAGVSQSTSGQINGIMCSHPRAGPGRARRHRRLLLRR